MRGYVWAVALSRLLDRPLIQPFNSRDLNIINTTCSFPLGQSGSNAADNAPPRARLMRAYVRAVAFSRLLDRPLIQAFNPRDLNTINTQPVLSL
jgi:hypothetical protein